MSVNISPRPSPSASASPSTTNTSSPSRMPLATVLPRVSSRLSELGWFVPYYFFLFSLQKQFIRLEPPWGHCKVGGEDSPHYVYKGFQYSVEVSPSSFTYPPSFRLVIGAVPRSSSSPPAGAVTQCSPFPPTSTLNLVKPRTTSRGSVFEMPPWLLETSLPRGRTTSVAVSVTSPASETSSFNTNCVFCRETNYEVTYSAARWPSGSAKVMECTPGDFMCLEKYRKNAAMIQIFYEELNYETLQETPAYTVCRHFLSPKEIL